MSLPANHASDGLQRLVIAMPALNEEATIADVIARIPDRFDGIAEVIVLVVDDGSTDRTGELARAGGAAVVRHVRPMGVGAAFQDALRYAIRQGADILATIDSDGQFNPEDLPRLVDPVARGEADFATASRFADPALIPEMPAVKRWGNRQMSRLISGLTRQRFYDVSCGMRCYNRAAMLNLNLVGRFTYTQEVFLNLAFKHMQIIEVPLVVRGEREFGKSRVAGSISRYALNTSRIIWRAYRDYRPWYFFGGAALVTAVPAFLLLIFLLGHYWSYQKISPHKWAAFLSGGLAGVSLMMLYAGIFGDMLVRHRLYLEELLTHARERTTVRRDRASEDDS